MVETIRKRLISVIGAGQADQSLAGLAREVGRLLAGSGFGVVTGGLGGVMAAACQGAAEAGGFTLGILPGGEARAANPYCQVVLPSNMGQARNALVVAAGEGAVAVGGAAGTLSEIGHALKAGKPVVSLQSWDIPGIRQAQDPLEAVETLQAMLQGKNPT
jgi:uncharacterized protein (TIGR00725 family)